MVEDLNEKLLGHTPITRKELFELVSSHGRNFGTTSFCEYEIKKCEPTECYNLSNLDVSQIDDLSFIFYGSIYNDNLSKWDVSNVKYMNSMFARSNFNNDSLNNWNISNVTNINFMFSESKFSGNINFWDVSKIESMAYLFYFSHFNNNISSWNINKKSNCDNMFYINSSFENKYNDGKKIPENTKNLLKWFEEKREKMKNLNKGSKEEVLDFFSFDSNLNKDINND